MSDRTHLQTLITNHTRRLQKLKERQAVTGIDTDPGILIEIEDIEAELRALQTELAAFKDEPEQQTQPGDAQEASSSDEGQIDLQRIEAKLSELQLKLATLERRSKRETQSETAEEKFSQNAVLIQIPPGLKNFGSAQDAILQQLYQGKQRVLVEKEIGGGFGGASILLVRPISDRGDKLARQIVKIGFPPDLKREQQNYNQYVAEAHRFVAADVTSYAEREGLGGIIYNYVGDSRLGQTRTFEEYFRDEQVSAEAINRTLEDLLDKALGEMWYHQTKPHYCYFDDEYGPHLVEQLRVKIRPHSQDALWPADQTLEAVESYRQLNVEDIPAEYAVIQSETLVQIEGLVITKVKPNLLKLQHPTRPGIVVKVETASTANFTPGQTVTVRGEVCYNRSDQLAQIVTTAFANFSEAGVDLQAETLRWGDQTYPNPLHLYPRILSRTLDGKKSLVHGDLHLRNILVDEDGHGWLIDFALVKERHNLYDFIKLETYIRQMVLSQPQYDFSFAEYLQFEAALLDESIPVPDDRMLRKAYEVIRKVRELAARYAGRDFDAEYWPALFLYNLAMVKYADNHGAKAARLAFGTAGVVGRAICSEVTLKGKMMQASSQSTLSKNNTSQETNRVSNSFRYHDSFTPFEIGLEQLGRNIEAEHPRYSDFLSYEGRLVENLRRSRKFGNTSERQAERAEVIDQLNELALSIIGVSFNELCRAR